MRKLLLSLLVLAFSALSAHADGVIKRRIIAEGGASCGTQSTADENTNVGTGTLFTTGDQWGQSWLNTSAITPYSISIYIHQADGDETVVMRIGTGTDMSGANYLVVMTRDLDAGTAYWYEFVIPEAQRPSLSASTTYYVAMQTTANFMVGEQSAGYANGTEYWQAGDTGWDLTGNEQTYDMAFRTKKCN